MRGQDYLWIQIEEPLEGGHILGEIAFGGRDHDRTDSCHQIAGEDGSALFQYEREMIEAMAGSMKRQQAAIAKGNDLAIGE